jgi:hypothetical protein
MTTCAVQSALDQHLLSEERRYKRAEQAAAYRDERVRQEREFFVAEALSSVKEAFRALDLGFDWDDDLMPWARLIALIGGAEPKDDTEAASRYRMIRREAVAHLKAIAEREIDGEEA